nr:immunoglobulin heavy chain junction region [Mus musculus]MBK4198313.1 immunoglobulin heavy chain junction region [Mus musculus]
CAREGGDWYFDVW